MLFLNTEIAQACTTAVCIKQAERNGRRLTRLATPRQEMFAAVGDKEKMVSC